MKNVIKLLFIGGIVLFIYSCDKEKEISSINPINWTKRTIDNFNRDSLVQGKTYLSVYSEIYSGTEHRILSLTATVSLRNININDTIFIDKAIYYNTHGEAIRSYFNKTIFIAPMETVEIVIDELDKEGGTGANFLFNWSKRSNSSEPFFESVMLSTSGQQGISITTQGKAIR